MPTPSKIDGTDRIILRILQRNAKKTAKDIAEKLHLTVSPVYDRIRRLEKLGVIRKYVAILDKRLLGQSVTTICQVSMRYHDKEFIEKFEQQIQGLDEVQECLHMAGQVDFILKIHTSSLEAYHNFIKTKLSKIENIGVLNSAFVLKEIKHTSEFYV